jgi:hypothetical protein
MDGKVVTQSIRTVAAATFAEMFVILLIFGLFADNILWFAALGLTVGLLSAGAICLAFALSKAAMEARGWHW